MEKSLKSSLKNIETIKTLFSTKKEHTTENETHQYMSEYNNQEQGSCEYNLENLDSDKEDYEELDESLRKSTKWTDGTDKKLRTLVEEYGTKNWKYIASQLKNKTPVQCLHRWNKILKPGLIKGPWTIEEDRKLLEWVKINGPIKWTSCSEFICGRSGKQCRERWFNTLNPNVKKGGWMPEEDFLIFKFFSEFGSKWSLIASKFPGRTENSVKNRFYSTLRRISLDKKKNLINDKKNVDAINNNSNFIINNLNLNVNNNNLNLNINNNNLNNNSTYFNDTDLNNNNEATINPKNNENSNLNLSSLNNPSSSLEELMKYLPQAFAEKTKIYLQFKKNEEKLAENLNINIDDKHELDNFDYFNFSKNENLTRILENNERNKFKKSFNSVSKKELKLFEDSNFSGSNRKIFSTNETKDFQIPKKNNLSSNGNISEFIESENQGNLNQTEKNKTHFGQLNLNFPEKLTEKDNLKDINNDFLQRKRTKEENVENLFVTNQTSNTFNINLNINQEKFETAINCNKTIRKLKKMNNENNEKETNQRIKKLEAQKYSKIEDLEHMIENFNEISSKTDSLEKVSENKNKKCQNKRLIRKNKAKKDDLEKLSKNSVFTNTDHNNLSLSENNAESLSSSNSNSNEDKKCIFKVPEICSNEEITKLSLNLMQRNNANQISFCNNSQNLPEHYLYLENEKTEKKGQSKKLEKEEIFKFDALNDLYDQLNNLESILLNTREQLFNLDRLFYKDNSKANFDFNSKKDFNNNSPLPKNLEQINSKILSTKNGVNEVIGINSIQKSNEKDKTKNHQVIFITENDCEKSIKKDYKIKNSNVKKDTEPFNNKNVESKKINEDMIKMKIKNEEILTAKPNTLFNLPNIDKNSLFFQDDLHFVNIGEMSNIKLDSNHKNDCGNNNQNLLNNSNSNIIVFNSNSLLNNFEGQLNEEQSFPYMDNMFQI